MSYQFFGGPVDGGTFPAQIWGDYMNNVKGSYCGDFAPPKEPFVSSPFFGRYANSGGKHMEGGDEEADATTTTPDATDDTDGRHDGRATPPPSDDGHGHRLRPRRLRVAAAGRARDGGADRSGPGRRRRRPAGLITLVHISARRAGITPADVSAPRGG